MSNLQNGRARDVITPSYSLASGVVSVPWNRVEHERIRPKLEVTKTGTITVVRTSDLSYDWKERGNLFAHEQVHFIQHVLCLDLILAGYALRKRLFALLSALQAAQHRQQRLRLPVRINFVFANDDKAREYLDYRLNKDSRCVLEGLAAYYQFMYEPAQYSLAFVDKVMRFIEKHSLGGGTYERCYTELRTHFGEKAYWIFPVAGWAALHTYVGQANSLSIGQRFEFICDLLTKTETGTLVASEARATTLQSREPLESIFYGLRQLGLQEAPIQDVLEQLMSDSNFSGAMGLPLRPYFERILQLPTSPEGYLMDFSKWLETPGALDVIGQPTIHFNDGEIFNYGNGTPIASPTFYASGRGMVLIGGLLEEYRRIMQMHRNMVAAASTHPFSRRVLDAMMTRQKCIIRLEAVYDALSKSITGLDDRIKHVLENDFGIRSSLFVVGNAELGDVLNVEVPRGFTHE